MTYPRGWSAEGSIADERLGVLVVMIDVVSDGSDEFFDIAKDRHNEA
jgi:hypothetical protein